MGDRQSKPGSPSLLRTGIFHPIKTPEQLLQRFFRDVLPIVLHGNNHFGTYLFGFDVNPRAAMRILQGIGNQIVEDTGHFIDIHFDHQRTRFHDHLNLHMALARLQLIVRDNLLQKIADVDCLQQQRCRRLSHFRVFEEIIDKHLHLQRFCVSDMDISQSILFTCELLILYQSQVSDDGCQRSTDVVTDVRDQLILRLFNLSFLFHRLDRTFHERIDTVHNINIASGIVCVDPMVKVPRGDVMQFVQDMRQLHLLVSPDQTPTSEDGRKNGRYPLKNIIVNSQERIDYHHESPQGGNFPQNHRRVCDQSVEHQLHPDVEQIDDTQRQRPFKNEFTQFFFFQLVKQSCSLPAVFFANVPTGLLIRRSYSLHPKRSG